MLLTLVILVLLATSWLLVFFYMRPEVPGPGRSEAGHRRPTTHPAMGPRADTPQRPVEVRTGTSTVPVQLVFTEASGDAVWIDCTLQSPVALPDQVLSRGHPMTLRCARPDEALDDAVGDVLERWAREGRTVDVEFFMAKGEPRVRLHVALDEQPTTLQLGLERAVA